MEKSWCPVPWKGVNVRNNGDFRVCCNANTSAQKGILRREDGTAFNAKTGEISAVRNAPLLKEIRVAMLKGERHETCLRCNVEDDSGVRSRRSYETTYWREQGFSATEARVVTTADGTLDLKRTPVGYYDLRFGNLCNLKCRMCGPTDSSLWHKEHFETVGSGFRDTSGRITLEKSEGRVRIQGENPYDWHESPEFWRTMEENLDDVKKIYTVGGEPLLIERHYELLRRLVESGRAAHVIMDYNSNITVIPPKALALWKEFKEVRIGASVDGFGKINEYIRHPSKWPVIEKNLDLLDQAEGNFNLWITTTVQIYNIFYLTDFLRWKIEKNFRRINNAPRTPFLTTHPLHSPAHFHVGALPISVKQMVKEKFEEFYSRWFLPYVHAADMAEATRVHWRQTMKSLLDGYVDFMFKRDLSEHLPHFWEMTKRMDLYRGESFTETMPEIAGPILRELKSRGKIDLGAAVHA